MADDHLQGNENLKDVSNNKEDNFDVNTYISEDSDEEIHTKNQDVLIDDNEEDEFSYDMKIPKDRIAVLIGAEGKIKRKIEKETACRVEIDSKEGDVFVFSTDGLQLYVAKNIVQAIARGFNPQVAMRLLKPDYNLELIDLNDYAKKQHHGRLKGRVIGKEGKSREYIEEYTKTDLCVYGKTVGVLGRVEYVDIAKRAVVSLLEGANHTSVFKWLEKKRRELKLAEITGKDQVL